GYDPSAVEYDPNGQVNGNQNGQRILYDVCNESRSVDAATFCNGLDHEVRSVSDVSHGAKEYRRDGYGLQEAPRIRVRRFRQRKVDHLCSDVHIEVELAHGGRQEVQIGGRIVEDS